MKPKFVFFLLFLIFCVHNSDQGLPINLLDPLNLKNPTVLFSLDQYLKNNTVNSTWAVLVAGSRGWDNYRHQSDVLHLYQILTEFSGLSKERVILMIADDLAKSSLNPEKDHIINEPNGTNLYKNLDLSKDYTGDDVSVDNFLKILNGDQQLAKSGKKVLKSSANENVLIYYSDHGNPGFLNFPDTILSASVLNENLEDLSKKKKINKMVVALESCYSGSIFDQNLLKPNLSIYAITATNSNEVSYSEFIQYDTYLSDVFSQNWFYSWIGCEKADSTLAEQFEMVRNRTNTSHVSSYGDLELAKKTKLNEFLHPTVDSKLIESKCLRKKNVDQLSSDIRMLSPSSDVTLTSYELLSKKEGLTERHHRLGFFERLFRARHILRHQILRLADRLARILNLTSPALLRTEDPIRERDCYENLVNVYHQNCYRLNEHTYLSRYLQLFYNACNTLKEAENRTETIKQLQSAIKDDCGTDKKEFEFKVE